MEIHILPALKIHNLRWRDKMLRPAPQNLSTWGLLQQDWHNAVLEVQNQDFRHSRNSWSSNSEGLYTHPKTQNQNLKDSTHPETQNLKDSTPRNSKISKTPHPETQNQSRSETLQTYTAHRNLRRFEMHGVFKSKFEVGVVCKSLMFYTCLKFFLKVKLKEVKLRVKKHGTFWLALLIIYISAVLQISVFTY